MKKRGLSLVEVLFSMLLMALILGLCAELMGGYANVSRYSSMKEQSTIAGVVALERLCQEASEATTWISPASPVSVSTLTFFRINPQIQTTRLPSPTPPIPLPVNWIPIPPAPATAWVPNDPTQYTMSVTYSTNGEQLIRQVIFPSGPPASPSPGPGLLLELATGVRGFSASQLPDGKIQVSLSFQNYDGSLKTLTDSISLGCLN